MFKDIVTLKSQINTLEIEEDSSKEKDEPGKDHRKKTEDTLSQELSDAKIQKQIMEEQMYKMKKAYQENKTKHKNSSEILWKITRYWYIESSQENHNLTKEKKEGTEDVERKLKHVCQEDNY